ncbi:hypothetical protein [Pedococcus sp. 2YAF34]
MLLLVGTWWWDRRHTLNEDKTTGHTPDGIGKRDLGGPGIG